jgi:propanediol dehydratase small subunit
MTDHPVVVIDHPIASKTPEAVQTMALNSTNEITKGLVS